MLRLIGPKPDPLAVLATDAEMAAWAGEALDGLVCFLLFLGSAGDWLLQREIIFFLGCPVVFFLF